MDFTHDMVSVALATSQSGVDKALNGSLSVLMKEVLTSMTNGSCLLLNLGMLAPDFNGVYTDDELFPADKVFDAD